MKAVMIMLAIAAGLTAGACADCAAAQAKKPWIKGAWVTAWSSGFFTPQEADATIAAAKSIGLNTLFIQVRKVADAYYESDIEPRGNNIADGFDPLAYVIKKAHANGIKVHAWVNVFRVWREKTPPADPNHIINRHPDWINTRWNGEQFAAEGVYLDPGVPEAREYIADVVKDIAARYNVDGIHLDYIRYPGDDWGYSETALARFAQASGDAVRPKPGEAKWAQWKRDQVTELLKLLRNKVHSAKPKLPVSAATIIWGDCPREFEGARAYYDVCQDWSGWLKAGLIDINVPMNYRIEKTPKHAAQFRKWNEGFKSWGDGKPAYVGIYVHPNTPANVLKQVAAVKKSGLDGFVLFSFNAGKDRDELIKAFLKQAK